MTLGRCSHPQMRTTELLGSRNSKEVSVAKKEQLRHRVERAGTSFMIIRTLALTLSEMGVLTGLAGKC